MEDAQGALEYLIIIAAVLGISAVVVLFVTGAFTGSSAGADISKCRLAASQCGKDLALGVSTSCDYCRDACINSATGKEVVPGAIAACMAGRTTSIVAGGNFTVGLVNNSNCVCRWTMSNCLQWWKQKLMDNGFNVESVDVSIIQDVNQMKKYRAILNPYGETYLDFGADQFSALDNIREYVKQGGYWFEYGGYPFYYKCSAGTTAEGPYGAGSQRVCISIGSAPYQDRTITDYGRRVSPNAPTTITGQSRPSLGNIFITSGCVPLASGATYNPIHNITGGYAGPAAHCYGSGCIVRSDRFNTNEGAIATIFAEFMRSNVF